MSNRNLTQVSSRIKLPISLETRELAQMAVLAAIFVIASAIPFTAFIGGAGFITFGIVFVPVIARMLMPWPALISGWAGALALYVLQLATAPVFGPFSLAIPVSGMVLGSYGFHYRLGSIVPWGYVVFAAVYYLAFSGGTMIWLVPYFLVAASLPLTLRPTKLRVPLLCLYSTMCELATMTIASISVLNLPGPLWSFIAPFMFFERAVATVGAFLVNTGIGKAMPGMMRRDSIA